MNQLLLVALGGAIGASARWTLGGIILHLTTDWRFPLSTFLVNVAGCITAGALAGLAAKLGMFSADVRLFLSTGLLGGFTTFSAFGIETVNLLRRGEIGVALLYVLASVICSIAGLWLAMTLTPAAARP